MLCIKSRGFIYVSEGFEWKGRKVVYVSKISEQKGILCCTQNVVQEYFQCKINSIYKQEKNTAGLRSCLILLSLLRQENSCQSQKTCIGREACLDNMSVQQGIVLKSFPVLRLPILEQWTSSRSETFWSTAENNSTVSLHGTKVLLAIFRSVWLHHFQLRFQQHVSLPSVGFWLIVRRSKMALGQSARICFKTLLKRGTVHS